MADDDTMAMIDLNKRVFSGAPLSPMENAKLRELIQDRERSKFMRTHGRIWIATVLTIPSALFGAYMASAQLYDVVRRIFGGGH